jgi:hypothetical protein
MGASGCCTDYGCAINKTKYFLHDDDDDLSFDSLEINNYTSRTRVSQFIVYFVCYCSISYTYSFSIYIIIYYTNFYFLNIYLFVVIVQYTVDGRFLAFILNNHNNE